jgi:hypothetical protein
MPRSTRLSVVASSRSSEGRWHGKRWLVEAMPNTREVLSYTVWASGLRLRHTTTSLWRQFKPSTQAVNGQRDVGVMRGGPARVICRHDVCVSLCRVSLPGRAVRLATERNTLGAEGRSGAQLCQQIIPCVRASVVPRVARV